MLKQRMKQIGQVLYLEYPLSSLLPSPLTLFVSLALLPTSPLLFCISPFSLITSPYPPSLPSSLSLFSLLPSLSFSLSLSSSLFFFDNYRNCQTFPSLGPLPPKYPPLMDLINSFSTNISKLVQAESTPSLTVNLVCIGEGGRERRREGGRGGRADREGGGEEGRREGGGREGEKEKKERRRRRREGEEGEREREKRWLIITLRSMTKTFCGLRGMVYRSFFILPVLTQPLSFLFSPCRYGLKNLSDPSSVPDGDTNYMIGSNTKVSPPFTPPSPLSPSLSFSPLSSLLSSLSPPPLPS